MVRHRPTTGSPGFRAEEFVRMHRVYDPGRPVATRCNATTSVAFSRHQGLGTIHRILSRLYGRAYAHPCQRFTPTVTDSSA